MLYACQKDYLILCRSNQVYTRKTIAVTTGIKKLHLYSATCKKHQKSSTDDLKKSVFRLITLDTHYRLNFLKRKLNQIENDLYRIFSNSVLRNIAEFQSKITRIIVQSSTKKSHISKTKQNKTKYTFNQDKL